MAHAIDSDGVVHDIFYQKQGNTCAIASIYMLECIVKKRTPTQNGFDRVWRISKEVAKSTPFGEGGASTFDRSIGVSISGTGIIDGRYGSFPTGTSDFNIRMTMSKLGFHTEFFVFPSGVHPGLDINKIRKNPALITLNNWNSTWTHLIVAAGLTKSGNVICLDPQPLSPLRGLYEVAPGEGAITPDRRLALNAFYVT